MSQRRSSKTHAHSNRLLRGIGYYRKNSQSVSETILRFVVGLDNDSTPLTYSSSLLAAYSLLWKDRRRDWPIVVFDN